MTRKLPLAVIVDQNGTLVQLSAERGKVVLLTFMYTHCAGLCPLTAARLDRAARRMRPQAVEVVAVSVDPRGDTRAAVRRFVRSHALHAEFQYLTGPAPVLQRIWTAYHVSTARYGDHAHHTLYSMLIDRQGRDRVLYDATATAGAIVHDLRVLLRG